MLARTIFQPTNPSIAFNLKEIDEIEQTSQGFNKNAVQFILKNGDVYKFAFEQPQKWLEELEKTNA